MILVTVGAQMPFDRLVRTVDDWAGRSGRSDVMAQIGSTTYRPRHLESTPFLAPERFRELVSRADAIVGHAGMGTIITALQCGKPLLVLPRLARLSETRNDHQVATARHFSEAGRVLAAYSTEDLTKKLDEIEAFDPKTGLGRSASEPLLERLRRFVFEEEGR